MRLYVLVVRDIKAGYYHSPLFVRSVGEAERGFLDECLRDAADNLMFKHPEDYELFQLGLFDTESAVFELLERPVSVAVGVRRSIN